MTKGECAQGSSLDQGNRSKPLARKTDLSFIEKATREGCSTGQETGHVSVGMPD